jgi:hypothetical protein
VGLLFRGYIEDVFWKIDANVRVGDKTYSEKVKFIIDPGSGTTILSPYTAKRIGIKFNEILNARENVLYGAGGECKVTDLLDTGIIFNIDGGTKDLMVKCPKISVPNSKSRYQVEYNLMGQDILKHFNVILCNKTKEAKLIYMEDTYILVPKIIDPNLEQ